jgi:hypothetical protein
LERRDVEELARQMALDDFGRDLGADLLVAALLASAPQASAEIVHSSLVEKLDELLKLAPVDPRVREAAMAVIDRLLAD